MKLKSTALFLLLFISLGIFSCKKSTLIGNDILPPGDDLNGIYTDTLTLFTKTVTEDPLKTSSSSKFLLGTIDDPVFGKSTASIYAQLQIGGEVDLGSPDSLFIDSLVLNLQYAGHYGKFDVPQNIFVYRVAEDMNDDSTYHSDKTFAVQSQLIGERFNFTPDFAHTPHELGAFINPSMRIRLSDRLGQKLLNESQSGNFASNEAFQHFFKGIMVTTDSNTTAHGAMYFSMNSSTTASHLTVFYHKPDKDSLSFNFAFGSNCAIFNHYTHNYTATEVEAHLNSAAVSDTVVYVQGMSGVKTKITLPFLGNLGNILVNKAELEITVPAWRIDADTVFTAPARMLCLLSDSVGKNLIIPDEVSSNLTYGGFKETSTVNGQTIYKYRFSITEHLQDLVSGLSTDYGLYLLTYPSAETADRVILAGGNRTDDFRMKLNLIYIKLP